MVKNKVNLQELFKDLQDELLAKLKVSRSIKHPTAKGDESELNWLALLKNLPARYVVDKGFVVDGEGNQSEQIDAIIYDRYYSPLILKRESTLFIPAESVYAILEVKPDLSKENLLYAGKKAKSVRMLKRTSAPVRQIDGSLKRREQLPPILSGLVANRCNWKTPLNNNLAEILKTLDENSRLDFGISLQNGSFRCAYSEKGPEVSVSRPETSLLDFYINLIKQLQLLGNAPGIDLDAYYKG